MSAALYKVFDVHHEQYEEWFIRNHAAYLSELLAVRAFLPLNGLGLEIGVGTGRFAGPLGTDIGLDPSGNMLGYAARKGISCVQGIAEALPFRNTSLDYCLIVTTICFVHDAGAALSEAYRVLKKKAPIILGFVDRVSALGKQYLANKAGSTFYKNATFYSVAEVRSLLRNAGFSGISEGQTLSMELEKINDIEPVRPGSGSGAFVVIKAGK
jgi:ubiquinone/menaquinone biosynthesis C-methylase UbiE